MEVSRHIWEVEFPRPVANARGEWSERAFLILQLRDATGRVGFGEASPLPGYSPDTLEAADVALAPPVVASIAAVADARRLGGEPLLAALAPCAELSSPAARHALELALVDLWARRRGLPLPALLAETTGALRAEVPLAGLWDLAGPPPGAATTWKVKLGASPLETLARVEASLPRPPPRLRFDANGSLASASRAPVMDRLARLGAEFLEEPGEPWPRAAPLPLARDESLRRMPATAVAEDAVEVLVLKPMVLGFRACMEFVTAARAARRAVVISHTFDGPIAWRGALALALALPPETHRLENATDEAPLAQGLGPHFGLRGWPNVPFSEYQAEVGRSWRESGLGVGAEIVEACRPREQVR